MRLFAAVLLGLASGLAQAQAPMDAKLPERPWRVVILNDADPTLPAFVAEGLGHESLRFQRTLAIMEQLAGTLFAAILIARLAGIYPPRHGRQAG